MKQRFWTTDWFAGLVYGVVFLLLAYVFFPNAFYRIETTAYDFGVSHTSATPSDNIAVIAIDDASIKTLGRWPWPRDYHARLINMLNKDGAKVIGLTVFLSEPQVDQGSVFIQDMMDFYDHCSSLGVLAPLAVTTAPAATSRAAAAAANCGPGVSLPDAASLQASPQIKADLVQLRQKMQQAESQMNTDAMLASSIKSAGNVVIPMYLSTGEPLGKPSGSIPDYLLRNALGPVVATPNNANQPLPTLAMTPPDADFAQAAAAVGFLDDLPDNDGTLRTEPLVLRYYDIYYPSFSIAVVMKALNLQPEDVQVQPGNGVKVGNLFIGTDSHAMMYNFYYTGSHRNPAFPVYSYADVYQGRVPPDDFKGKIVLIGATAIGVGDRFPTPASASMAPVMVMANVVSSILQQNFFTVPSWATLATVASLLLIILYIALLLPRLRPGWAALISLVLLIALFAVEFSFMKNRFVWIQLMLPALLLVTGHLVMTIKLSRLTSKLLVRTEADSAESNKMLGLAFQGQGQLDMAFEKFRKCPMDDSIADLLYNLSLDYERKRQFNKAGNVYKFIYDYNPKFRDVVERVKRSKQMEETVMLGSGTGPGGTLILGDGDVQKPMLGRYQVEKELAKGAMGVVYLGRDPKINRVVAIKTMALSQEFEADELDEVKQRFFREAETAGRLNHPNIVTIYDAGEEHDLAYIAMEFLKGKDLTGHTKVPNLLPPKVVMDIIAKAAEALEYANAQNVVHRDIKPANIMYEEAS
ncbi:MAG: CHASE2 domain-containing protein, partial [Gammaproteobacteria bacterium]|nr:CHASE2 domain-containing protein [Gammaproteobacteria bacterium]